jgi:hypothetical protein
MWSRLLSQGILGVISIRSAKESTKWQIY